ncbi:MAG TPA: hypothetical protein VHN77_06875 [Phycisphaerales bacterium]|nr:hypothetical protein [Phycisphaerales bacterium]
MIGWLMALSMWLLGCAIVLFLLGLASAAFIGFIILVRKLLKQHPPGKN